MPGPPRNDPAPPNPVSAAPAAVLLLDRLARARVAQALRARFPIIFFERVGDLLARVGSGPVSLVLVECRDHDGRATLPAVQAIRYGYPSLPVMVYASPGRTPSSEILAMAGAGVHDLLMQGFDDVGIALRAAVDSASRRCTAARVMRALAGELPPDTVPFVQFCLERAWLKPTVTEAAMYLGVHRKTLVYRLSRSVLPPPSAIVGWCRLFVAAQMLEDPSRSVNHVALALDFSSSAALRGMLRRYTGLRPHDVRDRGGLDFLLGLFRASLRPRLHPTIAADSPPSIALAPAAPRISSLVVTARSP